MPVAVVIPTLGRPQFVLRQLRYYERHGAGIAAYVGDASAPAEAERLAAGIRALRDLKCRHLRAEGLDERTMTVRLLREVSEPYCALSGDDDFLVPASLETCARFLATNADYRTAQGHGIVFSVAGGAESGALESVGDYWGRPAAEAPSAAARLAAHAAAYWVSLFSVHRTPQYLEDWTPFAAIPDRQFGEIGPSLLSVARGKSKFIDCLYVARQAHAARTRVPKGKAWQDEPHWQQSHDVVSSVIANAIAEIDKAPRDQAVAAFKEAFELYRSRAFAPEPKDSLRAAVSKSLRAAAPGMAARIRKAYRRGGPSDALALDTLMEKRSPYHKAFAAIRGCIMSGGQSSG